jgi:hypothetical protein
MEIKENYFADTKASVQDYLEDRLLLFKLQATDKVSKGAALFATLFIAAILGIVFLVLLGMTGGYFFASLTDSLASGFAIMTGIYLVIIVLVLVVMKKKIQSTVINAMIRGLFKKDKTVTNEPNNN